MTKRIETEDEFGNVWRWRKTPEGLKAEFVHSRAQMNAFHWDPRDELGVACHCGHQVQHFSKQEVWEGKCAFSCGRSQCKPRLGS